MEPLKITEVARKAEVGLRETYRHWKNHVMSGMVGGWYINWLGTWVIAQVDKTGML